MKPTAIVINKTALITQKNKEALEAQTNTLASLVRSIRVTDERTCQDARIVLQRIITAQKKAQAFVNPIIQNAKEGLRLAKEQESALVGPLENLRVELKGTINKHLTRVMIEEREQREEQERLKREHEEKLERSKRPERIKPLVIEPITAIVPRMENTSIPMVAKYEVEDESKIPEEYWKRVLDREKLWADVKAINNKRRESPKIDIGIPGVRIWEEASMTIRNNS